MAEKFTKLPSIYPKLVELRKSKTAEFKSNKYLRPETKLRYYQVVGALHMMLLNRMVLGDACGIGKCVSDETYVYTIKGLIKIKDLIKQCLWHQEMKRGTLYELPDYLKLLTRTDKKCPTALYFHGSDQGLKITTHYGFQVIGLPHHPILSVSENAIEFNKIENMRVGDYVCINRRGYFGESFFQWSINVENFILNIPTRSKTYSAPGHVTDDLAELIGFFISEGNSCSPQTFVITQYEPEINQRIRYLLKNCFDYEQKFNSNDYEISIEINSVNIVRYLQMLGIDVWAKSIDKVIPTSILGGTENILRSFLRGYFEGDGGVGKQGVVDCSSKSPELIKQIQLVLLSFGIISRIKRKMVKVKESRRPYWILYILGSNIDIFSQKIGFISTRKQIALNRIVGKIRNTNMDIIPFGKIYIKRALKEITAYLKTVPKQKGFSIRGSGWKGLVGKSNKRTFEAVAFGKRRLTYRVLNLFVDLIEKHNISQPITDFQFLKRLSRENFFFDKIENIEKCSATFVDFHIPDEHCFSGNGFINHNTLQSLSAYTWNLEQEPDLKLLVVTTKSALFQWLEELEKFTTGITVSVVSGRYQGLVGRKARQLQYQNFKENILIVNYEILRDEYEMIKQCLGSKYAIVFDECSAFKNRKSLNFFACQQLAESAQKVYGLSGTIIKNNLEEVWSIYAVIVPGLFGNITSFCKMFCEQKLMKLHINGKDRYIPKTTGYKNLVQFKQLIDPYILARRKEEVATELPKLISRKVILEMEPDQKELYRKALSGIIYEEKIKREFFEVYDKVRAGATDEKTTALYNERREKYEKYLTEDGRKRGKLAALVYCQMISNGPKLIKDPHESSKEIEFERLISEELLTEKILVFTRFKSGIHILESICEQCKVKYTKITGDVLTTQERDQARLRFQNDPECRIMFITTAGSASLNLQAAGVIIFYDTPWSYGDLVQTIGRAQRIGSIQEHILILHLINKGTIDTRVMNRVSKKKGLSDEILGDTAVGALVFTEDDDTVEGLYQDLLKDAENDDM